MIKKLLYLLIVWMPLMIMAQDTSTSLTVAEKKGVKWTTDLSWEQVKQKAKAENKYIFLDCFATWCGPCKQMEQYVFNQKNIGEYYNDKFVSVRVQFDKTKNDNEFVKSWYQDASAINRKYKIIAFPTFIFFKPDGSIVYKARGYQGPDKMMKFAKAATIPGKKYNDPYAKYDAFVEKYNKGIRDYNQMPVMIEKAKQIGDRDMIVSLTKEYLNHLNQAKKANLYTRTTIKFIAGNIKDSKSKFFAMFYTDGEKVNKTMGKSQYARFTIDRIINEEMMTPYLDSFINHITKKMIMSGIEPNWDSMKHVIATKYNEGYAVRIIRKGKHRFYWMAQQQVSPTYMTYFLKNMAEMIQNQDMDPYDDYTDIWINTVCWELFGKSTNEADIKMAIGWMKDVVARDNAYRRLGTQFFIWDTYANLLYKYAMLFHTNQFEEALSWEKKALQLAIDNDAPEDVPESFRKVIDKMNRHMPTWN